MGARAWGLAGAAQAMLLVAALYEPVRLGLALTGVKEVGGVGGVGGLTNLGNPKWCNTASGKAGQYCYLPGLAVAAGFSVFALVVVLLWSLPPLLGALAMAAKAPAARPGSASPVEPPEGCEDGGAAEEAERAKMESRLLRVWLALSGLWFLVPLVWFLSDPFFRKSVGGVVLAVSLAGSYTLSWHLALVAVPVSELVTPHLGLPDSAVKNLHKVVGWGTVGWAAVHGFGELFWFVAEGELLERMNVVKCGENLLYVMGAVTFVLVAEHAAIALLRKQQWLRERFRPTHRVTAAVLLLSAAAHWWPFALFLLPAAAVHGAAAARRLARTGGHHVSVRREALALAAAFVGAASGLAVVWEARDRHMQQPEVDMLSPFAFPPLALVAQGASAWAAALLLLLAVPAGDSSPAEVELLQAQNR